MDHEIDHHSITTSFFERLDWLLKLDDCFEYINIEQEFKNPFFIAALFAKCGYNIIPLEPELSSLRVCKSSPSGLIEYSLRHSSQKKRQHRVRSQKIDFAMLLYKVLDLLIDEYHSDLSRFINHRTAIKLSTGNVTGVMELLRCLFYLGIRCGLFSWDCIHADLSDITPTPSSH
ncbi:hypothetical protein ADUPG1_012072, partial [Aduncisulcus paluster]